ncbi:MAG: phage tail tape measure protein, partial [Sarcina sp.]
SILEKVQKQMQNMTLKVNMNGDPRASIKGVESAIDQLKKKMTNFRINNLLDEKTMSNAQKQLNSINANTPVKEIKRIKEAFKDLSQAENNIVRLQNHLNKLNLEKNKMNSSGTKSNDEVVYLKELENQIKITEAAMKKARSGSPVDSKKITSDTSKSTHALKQLRQEAQLTNAEMNKGTFGSAFGQMAQLVGIFNVAYMGMNMLRNSFREGFEAVKQMDSAMTTLSITMEGMTSEGLQEMATRSQEMATALYSTSNTVMEAVKTFANAGETVDSIFEKTSSAVILSNLTGLDIQTTVDTIQSAVKQFDALADGSAESSMKVADSMVAISKSLGLDFSKGVKEMSESISIIGSLSQQLGMDIDQTLAIVASGMEKMRVSGSEFATSLKTIMVRTMRIKSDGIEEKDWSKAEQALDGIGIKIRNLHTGEMRNFMDIMRDISKEWEYMDDASRMALGEAMGK